MTPLRRRAASLVWLALLAFAAAALPRDAWYVHRHAGDAAGHVHARDGGPVDDAWWEELLAESVAHRHAHGHARAVAGEGRVARSSARDHSHHHARERAHDEPRSTARGRDASDAATPQLGTATHGAAPHAHFQAPFHVAARPDAPALAVRAVATSAPAAPAAGARSARRATLRARAPPYVPSV